MRKSFNVPRALPICLFLIITTLAVFWQVKDHEFISYDDNHYVTENPQVQAGLTIKSLKWAFTSIHSANWHPLTWLSHMLDVQLFGLKSGWHHLINLFFHIANTLLLFLVLHRMTKALWQSAFVAALFALHPLHVESVAWVAERKDVLSTFFWMLTMGAYVFYVEKPEVKRYLLTLFFFALGLMAKPMLVTLPFVFLLLDYWPLRRLQYGPADPKKPAEVLPPSASIKQKRKSKKQDAVKEKAQAKKLTAFPYQWTLIRALVWEKIPFFILTAIASVVTYIVQQKGGAVSTLEEIPFYARVVNSIVSYVSYMGKMIWPANLAVFYPHPGMLPHWQVLGAALFLLIVTLIVLRMARSFPYVAVGWLWYLGTLVPVIGIVQVGMQGMADRYTYVPLIGLFIIAAWTTADLAKKWPFRIYVVTLSAGIILSVLTYTAWTYLQSWQNTVTIFQHALKTTRNNFIAHFNMGDALRGDKRKIDEAIAHYVEALRIAPNNPVVHNSLGNALSTKGKLDEAIVHYVSAIRIKPDYAAAYNHLGLALLRQGKIDEAIVNITKAIKIDPHMAEAYNNMGAVFVAQGKPDQAIANFTRALQIQPNDMEAHYNIGIISASQGKFDQAVVHFREAVRIKPDFAKAHNNMGSVLVLQGKNKEAIEHFREAVRIQPDYELAQDNLRKAMAQQEKAR
jgi:Tfp pilus assembly protein PilF